MRRSARTAELADEEAKTIAWDVAAVTARWRSVGHMARLAAADPGRLLATLRTVSAPASDPARRWLGRLVKGMNLWRRGEMVQRLCALACAEDFKC